MSLLADGKRGSPSDALAQPGFVDEVQNLSRGFEGSSAQCPSVLSSTRFFELVFTSLSRPLTKYHLVSCGSLELIETGIVPKLRSGLRPHVSQNVNQFSRQPHSAWNG